MSTDYNYLSCSNNIWQLYAGSDHTQQTKGVYSGNIIPDNPNQYAGVLKLSDNTSYTCNTLNISQGYESSVDINNHVIVNIVANYGVSGSNGLQVISVKGESNAVLVGVIYSKGIRWNADVLVDNWSDQAYGGSTISCLGLTRNGGGKVRITKRYFASKVTYNKATAEINYWSSFTMTAYWWIKWAVRKISGIKVGQTGPSWLG